jgi:hypothetical protein
MDIVERLVVRSPFPEKNALVDANADTLRAFDATRDTRRKTKISSHLNVPPPSRTSIDIVLNLSRTIKRNVVPITPSPAQLPIWDSKAYITEELFRPSFKPP